MYSPLRIQLVSLENGNFGMEIYGNMHTIYFVSLFANVKKWLGFLKSFEVKLPFGRIDVNLESNLFNEYTRFLTKKLAETSDCLSPVFSSARAIF